MYTEKLTMSAGVSLNILFISNVRMLETRVLSIKLCRRARRYVGQ